MTLLVLELVGSYVEHAETLIAIELTAKYILVAKGTLQTMNEIRLLKYILRKWKPKRKRMNSWMKKSTRTDETPIVVSSF